MCLQFRMGISAETVGDTTDELVSDIVDVVEDELHTRITPAKKSALSIAIERCIIARDTLHKRVRNRTTGV